MGWYEDSLFGPIAEDIAVGAPPDAAILEVGCGSGPLSVRLAAEHGLAVTAFDIEPRMIERARARARRTAAAGKPIPTFLVADVSHLPFEESSFELVVSTYSMHHWDDKRAGLAEISRVLRPDGRALIWDLREGFALFHLRAPDPLEPVRDGPLELVGVTEWPWPFGFTFTRRIDLRPRADGG